MNRPNWLDWAVYRFFRWWWNPIFRTNPKMGFKLISIMLVWFMKNHPEVVEETFPGYKECGSSTSPSQEAEDS